MNEFNVPLDNNARVNLVTASAPEVVFSNNNINGINAIKELNDTLKTANDGISKMYAQYKDMINSIIWEKYGRT